MNIEDHIRDIPDFPKPGIIFKDITPLLANAEALAYVVDKMVERYKGRNISHVVGVESRGFLFGTAMAKGLGVGFVPIRKKGKLPADTIHKTYELEYGEATVEIHKDALTSDHHVVLIDDLLATGGTLEAAADLIQRTGASVEEIWVLVELAFLGGRDKLDGYDIHSELIIGPKK